MNLPITVGIPTKDRYEALGNCLLSIALQTSKPQHVIIVDDGERKDIREIPWIAYSLRLLNYYGVSWEVKWKDQKGQHHSHQLIQEIAPTDWIFRMDDDCVLEPDCLAYFWEAVGGYEDIGKKLGAVAPCILLPNPEELPYNIPLNTIASIYSSPNIQWFTFKGTRKVEHLNSSFLYKKGIAKYNLSLSKVAHREETIFSHEIMRAGYDLLVYGDAKCWHYRQESGGIRSYPDKSLYDHDEEIFKNVLKSWNFKEESGQKIVVLDNGIGDHYAFLHIVPKLITKYRKLTIAACYPDVFFEYPDISLISIAEANLLLGDTSKYNIYTWMNDHKHKGNLVDAFNLMYD